MKKDDTLGTSRTPLPTVTNSRDHIVDKKAVLIYDKKRPPLQE